MTDEEKLKAFCEEIKRYWEETAPGTRGQIKRDAYKYLENKLTTEDTLKAALFCAWVWCERKYRKKLTLVNGAKLSADKEAIKTAKKAPQRFSEDMVFDYVPDYGGNRESENPCVVRLRFVPLEKIQKHIEKAAGHVKDMPVDDLTSRFEVYREGLNEYLLENIESVSGFFINGAEITNPKAFLENASKDLVSEILQAMEDSTKLLEGELKK